MKIVKLIGQTGECYVNAATVCSIAESSLRYQSEDENGGMVNGTELVTFGGFIYLNEPVGQVRMRLGWGEK